jgi:hypothetical protein
MTLFGDCGEVCKIVGITAYVLCIEGILVGGIEKWDANRGGKRGYIGRGRHKEINQQLNGVTAPSDTKHMSLAHEQIEQSESLIMSTSPSLISGERQDRVCGGSCN